MNCLKEDACEHAVKEYIQKGILADYLKKKGSQVVNMLIAEYDYDLDIQVQREEAFEDGKMKGIVIGKAEGRHEGEIQKLREIIKKKQDKGLSPEEIAEMLEEPLELVQKIAEELQ